MDYYIHVLKNYAVFDGRARRKEFWMFALFNLIFSIIATILDSILSLKGFYGVGIISMIYALGTFVPNLAVGIRRLHDTNHSGWWTLIFLVPFAGIFILLYLLLLDSTPGTNEYGPNPKGVAGAVPSPESTTVPTPPVPTPSIPTENPPQPQ